MGVRIPPDLPSTVKSYFYKKCGIEGIYDMSKGEVETRKGGVEPKVRSQFHPFRIKQFLQEVCAEFRKIAWPAKKTTAGLTGFVILLVILISLYLGSVDLLLGKLVATVLN